MLGLELILKVDYILRKISSRVSALQRDILMDV